MAQGKTTIKDQQSMQHNTVRLLCSKHGYTDHSIIQLHNKRIEMCLICQKERQNEAQDNERRKLEAEQQAKIKSVQERIEASGIGKRYFNASFDNYQTSNEQQEAAVRKLKSFAERFDKALDLGYGFMLLGSHGTGKNHLASAVIRHVITNGHSAKLTTVTKMIRDIRESWRKESGLLESKVIQKFVDYDLLVIDEVGVQYGTDSERISVSEVINDRYSNEKPTILISNLDEQGVTETLGLRIVERMRHNGSIIPFEWESYRK